MQQASFDTYAALYDNHFTRSLIGREQRAVVHRYLAKLSSKGKNVLELGCGTGEDALILAEFFKCVVCTDISKGMIDATLKKTAHLENCIAEQRSIQNIASISRQQFDVVFSNFGGLNCLDAGEMKTFAADCNRISGKQNDLIFVVMGRRCAWERFYFTVKGKKEKAVRRNLSSPSIAMIHGRSVSTYYYSPYELADVFSAHYTLHRILPVGLFVPPSYLENWVKRRPFVFSALRRLEKIFGGLAFLSDYADHYLIHLKKI